MPPKKAAGGGKAEQKAKAKVIEDKTFGLKNKSKSAKVQKYVAQVTNQVQNQGQKKKDKEAAALGLTGDGKPVKSKKEAELAAKVEMASLFHVVQKVPVGVDPKSVLCEYFKIGCCTKGNKCKYSHDLEVERKGHKIDLYTDRRDDGASSATTSTGDGENMENWDQSQLESVVDKRQGETNKQLKTDKVCKFFLEAIESKKYGWFWECPNGGETCMYRHALPPGYVLQSKKKALEEQQEDETPLEDILEAERAKLTSHTPVTHERFLEWKRTKEEKKKKAAEEANVKRLEDIKAGKRGMSGKEMFAYRPELFQDDDLAIGQDDIAALGEDTEDVPETIISVTGTSISLQRKGRLQEDDEVDDDDDADADADGGADGNDGDAAAPALSGVNASLFTGDAIDLPDDDDDEEDGEEDGGDDDGEE